MLDLLQKRLINSNKRRTVKTKDVFLDLKAIHEEFDDFQYDAKQKRLSVVSKSIQLEDTHLGRFRIELQLESLAVDQRRLL